jgi:hypothetical protein
MPSSDQMVMHAGRLNHQTLSGCGRGYECSTIQPDMSIKTMAFFLISNYFLKTQKSKGGMICTTLAPCSCVNRGQNRGELVMPHSPHAAFAAFAATRCPIESRMLTADNLDGKDMAVIVKQRSQSAIPWRLEALEVRGHSALPTAASSVADSSDADAESRYKEAGRVMETPDPAPTAPMG